MAEYINALILTYIAFVFAVLSPGQNVFGVLNVSLEKGRKAGVLFGLGIAFGSLTWATLSVLGLTQVIAKFSIVLLLVKIIGGCYLLYLAFKSFKSSKEISSKELASVGTSKVDRYFSGGYLLMMTNPKAALAWVAIVSLSTFNNAPSWVPIAAILGTFSLSVTIHISYAFIFTNKAFVRFYERARSKILKVFSAVYGGLGLKLLSSTS